jgi:hypothetical protein
MHHYGKKHGRLHRDQGDRFERERSRHFSSFSNSSSLDKVSFPTLAAELSDALLDDKAAPDVSEKNQLNIANIENGLDTRTTVMIKNIPNKMSDTDLMNFIARVCPRRIDFLYLRMDFQNGTCQVPYG